MSDFPRELVRISVVQICQDVGYQGIQASALETLTDIMIKYLEEIGYGTHLYAEASCRTDSNFLDFVLALRDCNGSLDTLIEYTSQVDEIPFAKPIPPFPIRAADVKQVEVKQDEESRPDHIPSYLPPFPGKHTYIFTPTFEERTAEPGKIRKLKNKRNRQVESSLAEIASHSHQNKTPHRAETPEYFSASNSNVFISSFAGQPPKKMKAKLKVAHQKFVNEENAFNEGERPQIILNQEDDGAEARRKQRWEDILAKPLTDTGGSVEPAPTN